MDSEYLKASRYDLPAQTHNRRVFHRRLLAAPGRALLFGTGMALLGAAVLFNWTGSSRWDQHPWMVWILASIAFGVAGYFFLCCLVGWRKAHSGS